ncbi:unnamed protein product [Tenebrio molitor]|nr:unnamed protein product [Tenebrio molitor]
MYTFAGGSHRQLLVVKRLSMFQGSFDGRWYRTGAGSAL